MTPIYHREDQVVVMSRLQSEFLLALQALENKAKLEGAAKIFKFSRPDSE